jgi:hypothetical protein
MDITDIRFSDDELYESSTEVIVFHAHIGTKIIRCVISRDDLNDHYESEDTKENALENYQNNKDYFIEIAKKLIREDRFNEDGEIVVTTYDLR